MNDLPENPEWLAILANTDVLASLPEAVLREVARCCQARTVDAGQVVFREGDAASYVLVVAGGLLDAFKRNDSGEPTLLRSLGPGDMAGLTSMAQGSKRSATLQAFEDRSDRTITDDLLARLMTFNNVLVTSHQAFLTEQALANIAATTLGNVREFISGKSGARLTNAVLPK